jgi:histidinol-phosphate aminotransferase
MRLVPKAIRDLKPYQPGKPNITFKDPGDGSDIVKLASNENPWGPSPKAIEAVKNCVGNLHRYPDMLSLDLRGRLAELHDMKVENVIVGSGSEGIMATIMRTFLCDEDEILTAENTFIGFHVLARGSGKRTELIPRRPDYRYDMEAMASAVNEYTKVIYIANPDNPTGTIITRREFDAFMEKVPERCLVIYDEAYYEFAASDERFPNSLSYRYDNVITLRTFSKAYGLAGVRVGYGFAHEELIENLLKVKLTFEPSLPAQVAALAAIEDHEFLETTLRATEAGRSVIIAGLDAAGLEVLESRTNFVTAKTDGSKHCAALCAGLAERGIFVRDLASFGFPELLRVTVGTERENKLFLDALRPLATAGR